MMRNPSGGDAAGLSWFKSSYSDSSDSSECVEVAVTPAVVHVRDSKDARRPHFTVAPGAWAVFVASC
ncbi:DUF397 domain-containing protein [Streptomyces sp. NPDC048527]|uniref:DUF397 domain-containing protein n=1 Tax=Streptomyces sp. NPDC048527 TaxID=3365568 RepID=UPI00372390A5